LPNRRGIELPPPDPERLEAATELADRAAEPALSANVLFGTAGWTDRSLVKSGLFYPAGASSPQARLEHYSRHFALVEVDATYYALLPPATTANWVEWTPPGFCFDVKAHPVLTGHPIDVAKLPSDLKQQFERAGLAKRAYPERLPEELRLELEVRFAALLEPLIQASKLGSVLAQFPPWFTATRGNSKRIELLRERFAGVKIAVEFRHPSWLLPERRERVFDLLRQNQLAYVVVDEPVREGHGVPAVFEVTDPDLAVVRFHGQNVAGWTKRGASVGERFDYLYTPDELAAWTDPVRRLAGEARAVHAVFNNCVRNYAVLNAKGLSVLLNS
jgi:uncharacterized protein YecE (DUF72 family)